MDYNKLYGQNVCGHLTYMCFLNITVNIYYLLWCYNNLHSFEKAFHYILKHGCGDLTNQPQEHQWSWALMSAVEAWGAVNDPNQFVKPCTLDLTLCTGALS